MRKSKALLLPLLGVGLLTSSCNMNAIGNTNNETNIYTVGGVRFKMVQVDGGTYRMGAQTTNKEMPDYDSTAVTLEVPVHTVSLSDYQLGETEVTQALWKAVMHKETKKWKEEIGRGNEMPVYFVTHNEIDTFLTILNDSLHASGQLAKEQNFCLPTEAEWEFAAKGGTKRKEQFVYAGSNNLDEVGWYDQNSGDKLHNVKEKKANELGLYDMSGNVWEWCSTTNVCYTTDSVSDPADMTGKAFIIRGGGYSYDDHGARNICRGYNVKNYKDRNLGFRLCLK